MVTNCEFFDQRKDIKVIWLQVFLHGQVILIHSTVTRPHFMIVRAVELFLTLQNTVQLFRLWSWGLESWYKMSLLKVASESTIFRHIREQLKTHENILITRHT